MESVYCNTLRRFLLLLPFTVLILTLALFLFHIPVSKYHFPVAITIALLISLRGVPRNSLITSSLFCLLVVVASLLVSCFMIDISYDGRVYHSPAAIALRDGWNPIYDASVCVNNAAVCKNPAHLFIDHYPKSQWIVSAVIYSSLGNIDAGKSMNILMLILVFLVAGRALALLGFKNRRTRIWLALLIAANPVALSQMYSAYVDGLMASLLTVYLLALIQYIKCPSVSSIAPALLIMPYLISLKFTSIVYVAALTGGFVLIFWVDKKRFPVLLAASTAATATLSIVSIGFNPYFYNVIEHHHPFYPVYNEAGKKTDVVDRQAAPAFSKKNRISKFFIANFSVLAKGIDKPTPQFKLPLTKLKPSRHTDPRFSGFGPLFSLVLTFSCVQLFFIRDRLLAAMIAVIVATIFITDTGWWARLAPQTWIAICLLQAAFLLTQTRMTEVARAMAVLLSINCLLLFIPITGKWQGKSLQYHRDLKEAASSGADFMVDDDIFFKFYNLRKVHDSSPALVGVTSCEVSSQNPIFSPCSQK